jgi:hypothetical protein
MLLICGCVVVEVDGLVNTLVGPVDVVALPEVTVFFRITVLSMPPVAARRRWESARRTMRCLLFVMLRSAAASPM